MTDEDIIAIRTFFPEWHRDLKPQRAALLSPRQEKNIISECMPITNIEVSTIRDWNLNSPNNKRWDLCIAASVLMYCADPSLWFENIFKSCDTIWMVDHIDRDRGKNQLGGDGDAMRYQFLPHVISSFPNAFDISSAGEVTKMYTYVNPVTGSTFNPDLQNLSIIAEIKNVNQN
tara:strand:- start:67 stop:588 length:522 start_codon:yes stop_codon:yes gene_type:complete